MTQPGPREKPFEPSYPTRTADPAPAVIDGTDCCGNCPGWKRLHVRAPFGQCLPARQFSGIPILTPDLAGCTMSPEDKLKGAR